MAGVEDFLKAPSEDFLDRCTCDHLLRIADHFNLDIGDKRNKDSIKAIVKANLTESGIIRSDKWQAVGPVLETAVMSGNAG